MSLNNGDVKELLKKLATLSFFGFLLYLKSFQKPSIRNFCDFGRSFLKFVLEELLILRDFLYLKSPFYGVYKLKKI